ncbi:hypothetical protein UlMin_017871 [Ulmus minor]
MCERKSFCEQSSRLGLFEEIWVENIFVLIGKSESLLSSTGNSTNIKWHECSIGKVERQKLLKQRGSVIWITCLSASDGDNVRHGLNSDLSFKAEDHTENMRRIGEVAKLFAVAGVICIASLISPYKKDRDAYRAMVPDGDFVEVFMDVPLEVCEARDPKGLYKLAHARKIKGFTGIDDPYEAPLNSEIVLTHDRGVYASPSEMAEKVISYLISSEKSLQVISYLAHLRCIFPLFSGCMLMMMRLFYW